MLTPNRSVIPNAIQSPWKTADSPFNNVGITSPQDLRLADEVSTLKQKLAIISKERDLYKAWKDNYSRFAPAGASEDNEAELRQQLEDTKMQLTQEWMRKISKASKMMKQYIKLTRNEIRDPTVTYLSQEIKSYLREIARSDSQPPLRRSSSSPQRLLGNPSPLSSDRGKDTMREELEAREQARMQQKEHADKISQLRQQISKNTMEIQTLRKLNEKLHEDNMKLMRDNEEVEGLQQKIADKKIKYANFKLKIKTEVFNRVSEIEQENAAKHNTLRQQLEVKSQKLRELEVSLENRLDEYFQLLQKKMSTEKADESFDLRSEVQDLQDSLRKATKSKDKANSTLKKRDLEIKQLEYEKLHLEKRQENLREQLTQARESANDLEQALTMA